jgi:hypothetical protein
VLQLYGGRYAKIALLYYPFGAEPKGEEKIKKRLRLFIGGYRELKRPSNPVDASLMQRIAEARERLNGDAIKPVRNVPPKDAPKRAA